MPPSSRRRGGRGGGAGGARNRRVTRSENDGGPGGARPEVQGPTGADRRNNHPPVVEVRALACVRPIHRPLTPRGWRAMPRFGPVPVARSVPVPALRCSPRANPVRTSQPSGCGRSFEAPVGVVLPAISACSCRRSPASRLVASRAMNRCLVSRFRFAEACALRYEAYLRGGHRPRSRGISESTGFSPELPRYPQESSRHPLVLHRVSHRLPVVHDRFGPRQRTAG